MPLGVEDGRRRTRAPPPVRRTRQCVQRPRPQPLERLPCGAALEARCASRSRERHSRLVVALQDSQAIQCPRVTASARLPGGARWSMLGVGLPGAGRHDGGAVPAGAARCGQRISSRPAPTPQAASFRTLDALKRTVLPALIVTGVPRRSRPGRTTMSVVECFGTERAFG
jgi:hypothetical protein